MPCDALEAKFQNNNLTACSVMRHYGSNPTQKYAPIWISPKLPWLPLTSETIWFQADKSALSIWIFMILIRFENF